MVHHQEELKVQYVAIALIVSLCIHTLILRYYRYYSVYYKAIESPINQESQLPDAPPPLAIFHHDQEESYTFPSLRAGESHFAPVYFFQEEHEENSSDNDVDSNNESLLASKEIKKDSVIAEIPNQSRASMESLQQETIEHSGMEQSTCILEKLFEQSKPDNGERREVASYESIPQPNPAIVKKKTRKKMNFAQLAQGFIEQKNYGGTDLITVFGDDDKPIDGSTQVFQQYMARILRAIQYEWYIIMRNKLNRHIELINNSNNPHLLVFLALDKHGNVQTELVQSSGNTTIDDIIMRGIRQAAPYPSPLQFLKQEKIKFMLNIANR